MKGNEKIFGELQLCFLLSYFTWTDTDFCTLFYYENKSEYRKNLLQRFIKKEALIKGDRKGDGRWNNHSLSKMYNSVKICLDFIQEMMETGRRRIQKTELGDGLPDDK